MCPSPLTKTLLGAFSFRSHWEKTDRERQMRDLRGAKRTSKQLEQEWEIMHTHLGLAAAFITFTRWNWHFLPCALCQGDLDPPGKKRRKEPSSGGHSNPNHCKTCCLPAMGGCTCCTWTLPHHHPLPSTTASTGMPALLETILGHTMHSPCLTYRT